jgi:hypothetical protein
MSTDPDFRRLYIASYLRLRIVVGLLGISLPVVLLLGEFFLLAGSVGARESMSAYYHSGMRDVFVGSLWTIGFFLLTYGVAAEPWENVLTSVAGVAAVVVAIFPTALPAVCDSVPAPQNPVCGSGPTPLQLALHESTVSFIHVSGAIVFFGILGVTCYNYGRDELLHPSVTGRRSPRFWRAFHWTCAGIIAASIAAIAGCHLLQVFEDHINLVGEAVMCLAFGTSWLAKGLDLPLLAARTRYRAAQTTPS